MRKIQIQSINGNVIAELSIPKAPEYTREQIESALGRKLEAGEQIVFNA